MLQNRFLSKRMPLHKIYSGILFFINQHSPYLTSAITSISTKTSFGSRATSTQERAGL